MGITFCFSLGHLTLKINVICPFVAIDHSDIGAAIVVAHTLCLTMFNYL